MIGLEPILSMYARGETELLTLRQRFIVFGVGTAACLAFTALIAGAMFLSTIKGLVYGVAGLIGVCLTLMVIYGIGSVVVDILAAIKHNRMESQ